MSKRKELESADEEPVATDARARRFPRWKLALWGVAGIAVLSSPLWGPPVLSQLEFFCGLAMRLAELDDLVAFH